MHKEIPSILFDAGVFAAAALISFLLTPLLIQFSLKRNLLDYPEGRKAHQKPTPYLGGAALFVAFWIVIFAGIPALAQFQKEAIFLVSKSLNIISKTNEIFLGGLLIFILGLADDRFNLAPWPKLAGQAAAALILIHSGITVNLVASLGILGDTITFFWLILLMNAFNFIDSVDGHCAGVSLISCFIFFSLSIVVYQPVLGFFVMALAGALAGFLPYNLRHAKIFLGDNGSLFIGYIMAAITLLCTYRTPGRFSGLTPFIPILMFGVPIYDMVSVVVVRIFRGIPPWKGDRNHFAHRLVRLGMSEKVAVMFSYFITFTLGLVALLSTQVDNFLGKFLVLCVFVSIIGVIALLEYYAALRIRRMERLASHQKRRRGDKPFDPSA